MSPRVSVLMSCFNAADYLPEAIESVLSQTFADFEFVIVDDGSTDRTLDVVRSYAAMDTRIVVVEKRNTGLADSLNTGMRMARGEWIARLDADDIALPIRLEKQIAYIDRHPQTVFTGSGFTEIDSAGNHLRDYLYPAGRDRCLRRIKKLGSFPPHSSFLYHKAAAEALGGFNPRFRRSQDADLWFRLSRVGEIGVISMPLVKIRKHNTNISNEAGGRIQAIFGTAAQTCHFLRMHGVPDPSQQSDAEWQQFVEWLTMRIEQSGLFELGSEWVRLKQSYFFSDNRVVGACRLLKGLATSPQVFRILQKKCLGSNLAARLTEEWIQRQCAGSSE